MRHQHKGLHEPAPAWQVSEWLNVGAALHLETLRGRVIALHAFQMLCPGCVTHGILQAQRMQETFAGSDLTVVGLHTVFEHHDAMRPHALRAFLHEYRVGFPVGVDAHADAEDTPITMRAYAMYGTPTLILIDRGGIVRYHVFGRLDDMMIGARVAALLCEAPRQFDTDGPERVDAERAGGCGDAGCELDP